MKMSFVGSPSLSSLGLSDGLVAACRRARRPSRCPSILTLSSGPDSSSAAEKQIDFSDVNLTEVGKSYQGMIFKPDDVQDPETRCNVGWTKPLEDAINEQINVEYTASYAYHAIWAFFNRDTVALPGFAKYFMDQSLEERSHATQFMEYQNKRGGKVLFRPVAVPEMSFADLNSTSDAVFAIDLHLQLEKFVYHKLRGVHKVAEQEDDPQLQDEIEGYLKEQVDAINSAASLLAQLKRVGTGHGIYHIDRVLLEEAN